MCGIAGVVALDGGFVDPAVVQRMTDRIAHCCPYVEGFRLATGPYGQLCHSFAPRADLWAAGSPVRVALGHRRLAILDLSDRGAQPMRTPDGRTWIAFNGEIYNHLELRERLASLGYVFHTRTDTEVLLDAYLEWGDR